MPTTPPDPTPEPTPDPTPEPTGDAPALAIRGPAHRPWLFYREGLDWCWKSFRRVVGEVRDTTLESGPRPAPPYGAEPHAVAQILARGLADEHDEDAAALEALLPAPPRPASETQPIVFASPSVVRAMAPTLAALTLRLGAAWPLEPADDAFVATARWLRPTVILGLDDELHGLAAAWDGGDRKWSRLVALVRVVPAAVESPPPVDELASAFGVPVVDVDGP